MVGVKRKNKAISDGNKLATASMYAILVVVCFITVYPMYYVLILSLSDPLIAMTMKVYVLPIKFNLQSYTSLVKNPEMWRVYLNTIMYALSTTGLMLITSTLMGYPLTVKGLPGRKFVTMFLLIPMYFGGGLIPSFLLINRLGMYDTPWALVIPSMFSIWNIILMRSYFGTIPETLRESARIDGANSYQILLRVYLPMATPILAVISVYTIVGVWNSWFSAMIYLPHKTWQPLQLYLRRILLLDQAISTSMSAEAAKELMAKKISKAQMQYSMIIFCSLPILCAYPFFQRYFVKGVMLGSLKE